MIIYSAFADAGLAVRAAIAGAEAVLRQGRDAARRCSPRCATARPSTLDARALRALGERLDPDDLPILGMLAHGVAAREIAVTLGLERELAGGAPLGDAGARWVARGAHPSRPRRAVGLRQCGACPREIRSSRR